MLKNLIVFNGNKLDHCLPNLNLQIDQTYHSCDPYEYMDFCFYTFDDISLELKKFKFDNWYITDVTHSSELDFMEDDVLSAFILRELGVIKKRNIIIVYNVFSDDEVNCSYPYRFLPIGSPTSEEGIVIALKENF